MPEGFTHIAGPDPSSCFLCSGRDANAPTCAEVLTASVGALDPDRIAAVIVEPVNGRNGIPLPAHYLRELRELCSRHDIVLVFDEVLTGFGRMGALFAAELSGVCPDLLCVAKGITNGYAPLGAVLAADHIYDAFNVSPTSYFAHASSTDAHPVSCAAGLATLSAFESEGLVEAGQAVGERIRDTLAEQLAGSHLFRDVHNTGAFIALELVGSDGQPVSMQMKRYLERDCVSRRVLIDYTPEAVILMPPLILTIEEIETLAGTLARAISEFDEGDLHDPVLRPPTLRGHR
jgi:adenosylmethionine-8-amino-7-oxononanoate aminotransferase